MKTFDLEKALAGESVITRDGATVEQLHAFYLPEKKAQVFGVVNGYSVIFTWEQNGTFNLNGEESGLDLFMAPKKKTVWVNMWRAPNGICSSSVPFNSEQEAKAGLISQNIKIYIGTYPIEIEL